MNSKKRKPARLDLTLAWILSYGTWIASALIAAWLVLPLLGQSPVVSIPYISGGLQLVTVGIAVIIMLPVLRVITMLIAFLHKRDYRFAAIAALVLLILLFAFAIGATSA
ncbi:DUF1634 domain-containing protein [Ktedonobacteria bacterium brp13]|nr:DUF1634 domain-containing protein [Ktedonobacteria bacterium brp13]